MLLLDPADAASPPSAATCPYLAPADDIDSVALYPRADHRCRATGGNQPDLAWQQQYCLSIDYQRCRFYQPLALLPQSAAASASMQTADHQTQPSRPRPWRRIRLILLAAIALLLVAAAAAILSSGSGDGMSHAVATDDPTPPTPPSVVAGAAVQSATATWATTGSIPLPQRQPSMRRLLRERPVPPSHGTLRSQHVPELR